MNNVSAESGGRRISQSSLDSEGSILVWTMSSTASGERRTALLNQQHEDSYWCGRA